MNEVKGKRSPKWAIWERMEIPCENGDQYLTRLRIVQTPWFGVYLHNLYSPDVDKFCHDHPWNFISVILRGGYREIVYTPPSQDVPSVKPMFKYNMWQRGSIHRMSTDRAHRVTGVDSGTLSLLLVGRRKKNWGFYTRTGWVDWKTHEENKRHDTDPNPSN